MGRVAVVLLISIAALVMACSDFGGARNLYAEGGLYISATPDSEKEKAIGIAKEVCDRERLGWEDVAIRSLGEGRWRITITSFEQGRTLVVDIDSRYGKVLSKTFK